MKLSYTVYPLIFTFAFLWHSYSMAQNIASVRVEPALTEDLVNPGDIFSSKLTITNLGNGEQTLYLYVHDINGIREDGSPIFAPPGEVSEYELSSWLELSKQELTLGQGESETVEYSVTVPDEATPGVHFGSIFATTDPKAATTQGASVSFQVGAILSLNVSGAVSEDAIIREFSTEKLLYSEPDITFAVRVENRGNTLLRPRGPVEVTDMFGKKRALLVLNEQGAAIGPKSERSFSVQWKEEGFQFGRFEAVLGLTYGVTEKKTVSATLSFWILPMKTILPVLGTLFVLLLGLYFGIKIYIRRTLRDQGVIQVGNRAAVVSAKTAPISRLALILIVLLSLIILFLIGMFVLLA